MRAALLAIVTGSTLGGIRYAFEPRLAASAAIGIAVALILFVMLAFPEVANRRLSWRRRPETQPAMTLRPAVIRVTVAGAILVGLALWLRSLALFALAAGHFAFWSALIYIGRRRLRN